MLITQTSNNTIEEQYLYTNASKIVPMHDSDSGVLGKYYRDPWVFYINFFLSRKRMPTEAETDGREIITEKETIDLINGLDDIFEQIEPLSEPIIVFKGIRATKISDYPSPAQFQSTSLDIMKTNQFAGVFCCVFAITIPAGMKVILTKNEFDEVILDRNVTLVPFRSADIRLNTTDVYYANAVPIERLTMRELIEVGKESAAKFQQNIMEYRDNRSDMMKDIEELHDNIMLEIDFDRDEMAKKLGVTVSGLDDIINKVTENDLDIDELQELF